MTQHLIATVFLDLVYIASGLALCLIGKGLLFSNLSVQFLAEGEVASKKLKIMTTSPGLVFLTAGLAVIIAAIVDAKQFRYEEIVNSKTADRDAGKERPQVSSGATPAADVPTGRASSDKPQLQALVRRITSYSLAAKSTELNVAGALVDLAKAQAGRREAKSARESIARAVGLVPTEIKRVVDDPDFKGLMQDPLFRKFLEQRILIALAAQEETPLSPEAEAIIAKLQIRAGGSSATAPPDGQTHAIITEMPRGPGREPSEKTVERVKKVISLNPAVAVTVLRNPQYRWMFDDPKISAWLKTESDFFFMPQHLRSRSK